jgi:hypothetical protein
MEKIAKPLALLALVLTIGPPAWIFVEGVTTASPTNVATSDVTVEQASEDAAGDVGFMTDSRAKFLMALGAVLWFVAAPFWLKEDKPAQEIIEKPGLQAVP